MKAEEKTKENLEKTVQDYVLKKPHISEKATLLSEDGFYVFKVEKRANKNKVKEEVEKKYKVDVVSVKMISVPSKKRRVGKTEGKRRGYKKAIVKVKKGQNIDLTLS
jgi:large subunit ribosomal protein L23